MYNIGFWRYYSGNRFSEDIDAYIPKDEKKINALFLALERKGLRVEKRKVTENSLYSTLQFNRVLVRLEALFKHAKGDLREYAAVDGNLISVYVLSPEGLLVEKVSAYCSRQKVRDLYDIFFLLRYINNNQKIKTSIAHLMHCYKAPVDEPDIKTLILEGLVPTSGAMLEYIKHHG